MGAKRIQPGVLSKKAKDRQQRRKLAVIIKRRGC